MHILINYYFQFDSNYQVYLFHNERRKSCHFKEKKLKKKKDNNINNILESPNKCCNTLKVYGICSFEIYFSII